MPWEVKKSGNQYCVFKKGTNTKVPGGCHPTKKAAEKHKSALYVNVHSSVLGFAWSDPVRAEAESALRTIPNVPIVSTGIEYKLGSGPHTFTQEELEDAIQALGDPAIVQPRLTIGHGDKRFTGEPAVGIAANLRLGDNNQTIYCDYVGVPAWLAEIMPIAYPNRSIEGNLDVETVTGNKYRLVIEAVALLGVVWPGVSTLDDLPLIFSEEGPEGVEVVAGKGGTGMDVTASVNIEDVRRAYYDHLDAQGSEYAWWWIRAMYVDPNELIVDDDDGNLYRVPFSVTADGVAFDEAVQVEIEYVDVSKPEEKKAAASAVVAGLSLAREKRVVYASREESRPRASSEGGGMDAKEVRSLLGLAEDATDDAVREAIKAKNAPSGESPQEGNPPSDPPGETEEGDGNGDGNGDGDGEEETPPAAPEQLAASGAVLIDKATLAELQAGARAGLAAQKERLMDEAIKAGKFPPARREHYERAFDADAEGTEQLIASLADNVVPVDARGASDKDGEGQTSGSAYPEEWLPEVAARKAMRERGETRRVMTEA